MIVLSVLEPVGVAPSTEIMYPSESGFVPDVEMVSEIVPVVGAGGGGGGGGTGIGGGGGGGGRESLFEPPQAVRTSNDAISAAVEM